MKHLATFALDVFLLFVFWIVIGSVWLLLYLKEPNYRFPISMSCLSVMIGIAIGGPEKPPKDSVIEYMLFTSCLLVFASCCFF